MILLDCITYKQKHIYYEIRQGMYDLPQASKIANDLLKQRLFEFRYYETLHTPGLWKDTFRPIHLTLVVDDASVNCFGQNQLTRKQMWRDVGRGTDCDFFRCHVDPFFASQNWKAYKITV